MITYSLRKGNKNHSSLHLLRCNFSAIIMEILVVFSSFIKNKWATVSQLPHPNMQKSASLGRESGEERGPFLEDSGNAQGTFSRLFGKKHLQPPSVLGSRSATSSHLWSPSSWRRCPFCWSEGTPACGLKH